MLGQDCRGGESENRHAEVENPEEFKKKLAL
jgi:hypothetical protein